MLFAAAIGGADLYAKAGDVAAADALGRCMHLLGETAQKSGAGASGEIPKITFIFNHDLSVPEAALSSGKRPGGVRLFHVRREP